MGEDIVQNKNLAREDFLFMPSKIDLTGMTFGKLKVICECGRVKYGKQAQILWECECECGNHTKVASCRLRSGMTKSCGCLSRETGRAKMKDITGQRFGRLVAVERAYDKPYKRAHWLCQCNCGNTTIVSLSNLSSGKTISCGCYKKECLINEKSKHGESHTRLYSVWMGMKDRCYNPKHSSYYLYGERGIRVCDEWLNSYINFKNWAESNGYDWTAKRGDCTLDRIDVNGNYCPQNCRWVDMKIQNSNKRDSKAK